MRILENPDFGPFCSHCGGDRGIREPGDLDGLGCLENIYHRETEIQPKSEGELRAEWEHAAKITLLSVGQPDHVENMEWRDELLRRLQEAEDARE